MTNHDAAYKANQLRAKAINTSPLMFVVTPDDIAALRAEGHGDAEIEAAIAMLAPHLERAARLLPGALTRRANEIEGAAL